MTTPLDELISYHAKQASYCRLVRLQSWGRSAGFKQMWLQRERFHRNAAKALTSARANQ